MLSGPNQYLMNNDPCRVVYEEKTWTRNDRYTHFSQQLHNKLMWLVIFYNFFCFVLFSFCKKIIKYYQPRQLVVELL
jgi:hypothetical protein